MAKKTIPAISIIIPMYNAEKYIGECLDSILAQTFQDFEVIVVDDCSTDNSVAAVENYLKNRGGGAEKIQLVCSKVNSGGAGTPRNMGIRFSRGEYIMFIDSDDAITKTALEELYNIATSDVAIDVVHCEKFYISQGETATTNKKYLKVTSRENINFVTDSIAMTDNILERIQIFAARKYWSSVCNNLFKRELIIENNLNFPNTTTAEDGCFTVTVLLYAKKIIRVPNVFYIYRQNQKSVTHSELSEQKISKLLYTIFEVFEFQDNLINQFEIFQKHKEILYALFDKFFSNEVQPLLGLYQNIPAAQLDNLIRHNLEKVQNTTALTAFIFSRMNVFNVNLIQQQNIINQQQIKIQQLQAQIQQL